MRFFKRDVALLTLSMVLALIIGLVYQELWPLLGFVWLCWLLALLRQRWLLERSLLHPSKYALPKQGFCGAMLKSIQRATALQCEQELLIERTTQLKNAFEAMSDGMVILNKNLELSSWNKAANDLLGLNFPQDLYSPITAIIRHPKFAHYCEQAHRHQTLILPSPINQSCSLEIQVTAFEGQSLLIARDITRAQRLEQMQRDFVANVSHELNTPLTVLMGYLEPLSEIAAKVLSERMIRGIQHMKNQTQRMQHLIKDLLLLARLESEVLEANKQVLELLPILIQAQQDGDMLSQGQHQIAYECLTDAKLLAAPEEIRSALTNLVSNAIRYSGEGKQIQLRWSLLASGEGALDVIDNGVGIAKCHLSRLSERFYRVDKSRSSATGGTGLGLAIVKRVLIHHQGHLEIESNLGHGAQFRLRFPKERLVFNLNANNAIPALSSAEDSGKL